MKQCQILKNYNNELEKRKKTDFKICLENGGQVNRNAKRKK